MAHCFDEWMESNVVLCRTDADPSGITFLRRDG
jgi:hypothetical protein